MRITIASGPFYPSPPAPTGAVQRYWFDLAREFVRRGHTVHVVSSGYRGFPSHQAVDGVSIHRLMSLPHTRRVAVNLAGDLLHSVRAISALPAADITITNCFWLPAIMSRAPSRARWGAVYVSVARVPKGQMWLYSRVDRLHAVSSAIARWIAEERPASATQTKVIPNPIDTRHFNVDGGPTPCAAGPTKTIIYTGRIHPEKGLDILVRALPMIRAVMPEVSLRLVGPTTVESGGGGESFVGHLHALARGQPVRFDPPIYDRATLATALRQADVYCYPSTAEKGEAAPVAPLEAMGVGLVPVCSDLPQYRDYLQDGVNGVIFDHRGEQAPRRLADALVGLLQRPERLRQMGAAAARTAAGYSNEAIASLFLEDFELLVRSRKAQSTSRP